jgi:predicted SAM-dependent methyltransferase
MSARVNSSELELPEGLLSDQGRGKLHLGGTHPKDGWEIMNALPGDHVDHLGDVRDLSRFSDSSYDVVYASHIVEHLGYVRDLGSVLSGVARVLRPGGRFFVSVPDLETLCSMFADPNATSEVRFVLMRMMFGGQVDQYDFHHVGLWDEYLAAMLFQAGFSGVYRVPRFGIFDDTSELVFGGKLISLNMVAVRGDG